MSKYKATFTTLAEVIIEFEVDAANQQEGLVLAHDYLHQARNEQARIVRLDTDKAVNVSFERVQESAQALPPSPLELAGKFKVQFFTNNEVLGAPAIETEVASFAAAKPLAESLLQEASAYGSARVLDEMGHMVLKTIAPRGGWEVEAFTSKDGETPAERYTWLRDLSEAKQTMLQLLARVDMSFVRIYDYTDRRLGPVLWREIR